MDLLLAGYRRFRASEWPGRRQVFESLAEHGQKPKALVVACIDSRVDPGMIFDTAPGEVLTVRNVANLVPPYAPDSSYHGTSAALEFAVRVMEVPLIIVLGHGLCGGVQALMNGAPATGQDFIAPWMSLAEPARARALGCGTAEEQQECCEREVVRISVENLLTFPWIADRVAEGKLAVRGGWFAISTGVLAVLQADGSFAPPV
jgi:carbonic anhydrase